eukprot:COSAG06_NODE_1523_length_9173_cov_31.694682_6_plen_65_part_00
MIALVPAFILCLKVQKLYRATSREVRETPVLSHCVLKTIKLPRQARDKHRESTPHMGVFRRCYA